MSRLPQPTRDIKQALSDMDEHGYCMVAGRLNANQMAAMTERYAEQMAAEAKATGKSFSMDRDDMRGQLTGPLNKGRIWRDMITPNDITHQIAAHALTPAVTARLVQQHNLEQRYIISSMNVLFKRREVMPESKAAGGKVVPHMAEVWHIDQSFIPWHTEAPLSVNSFTALTDYTVGNGATIVVPGSHRKPTPKSWAEFDGAGKVHAEMPAGTTLLIDARIWHAAGLNVNGELRGSANIHYIVPWLRQGWNAVTNLRQDVVDELSDTQLKMLGFDTMCQSEYGAFAGPNIIEPTIGRENVTVKQRSFGELHLA
jgi:ectoine hydroxylase-related dioxygenase (phytanoyl-CoA dioxygenase family)